MTYSYDVYNFQNCSFFTTIFKSLNTFKDFQFMSNSHSSNVDEITERKISLANTYWSIYISYVYSSNISYLVSP